MYVYIKKICLENFVTLMNKNIMNRINKINLKDIKKKHYKNDHYIHCYLGIKCNFKDLL